MYRIVGDDDGGKMFSEKQYEEYKWKNPHKVAALKKNFMDIAGQEDRDELYDPRAILGQATGSVDAYKMLAAIEGEEKPVPKGGKSVGAETSALDLFITPHGLGGKWPAAKAITTGMTAKTSKAPVKKGK